jgi:predicted AlkP superfamily phosphohydrolase/phosphomutase
MKLFPKEIRSVLGSLKGEEGDRVIDKIFMREEIYHGPYANRAPDMVCLPMDGYDLKGSLEKKEIWGRQYFTGMHTWHDAFSLLPKSIGFDRKPSIEQWAGIIMNYFTE